MPRKPQKKVERITVIVGGEPITVSLYPPNGRAKTWYVYWNGLEYAKSTGCKERDDAVTVAEQMVRGGGNRLQLHDLVPSDDEFIEIQRAHYGKKQGEDAQKRAQKSLRECLDAIEAFRRITELSPVTIATPEDCERFQHEALKLPKNWRIQYADTAHSRSRRSKRPKVELLSPNTVIKWSVALQAAFERANRNGGKKCVRSVVPKERLLTENPWRNFTWIEAPKKKIRQFDESELIEILDLFEAKWPDVTVAPAFVKVCLWSWARRDEVSRLRWSDERMVNHECHFTSTGKWDVTKWFRIPSQLRAELEQLRTSSDYVFSAYTEQLRRFHDERNNGFALRQLRDDFAPENLGDWIYRQIAEWSADSPKGRAYLHVFRKTGLQHAVAGGNIEESVAADASVTHGVMMASYASIEDEELRHKSNRTFARIKSSLSVEVATRYGYQATTIEKLTEQLDAARLRSDWSEVVRLGDVLQRFKDDDQEENANA